MIHIFFFLIHFCCQLSSKQKHFCSINRVCHRSLFSYLCSAKSNTILNLQDELDQEQEQAESIRDQLSSRGMEAWQELISLPKMVCLPVVTHPTVLQVSSSVIKVISSLLFKLRLGASRGRLVGRSVGRSVGLSSTQN